MEIKGIDVSAWQGAIDWKTVADYGMDFAILRITEQGNKIDSTFEANYQGCTGNGIPVGVYKYSYAESVADIQKEAEKVVEVLSGRRLDFPVWLDLEYPEQREMSESMFHTMIQTFWSVVVSAGYRFGIYCNMDWYNNVIPEEAKSKYDFWIASYPANDDGWLQERLRPSVGVGWQYSSKATIPGIPTKVDRNVFYKDYKEKEEAVMATKQEAINKVLAIAKAEVGYLEKASNASLDSKTDNAGYNNYTKYWRDVYPSYQGQPWCAAFVSWVFMKAFGQLAAKKLLKHWPYVYCPTLGNLFTRYANPETGDIVIFYRNGEFAHTGIVTKVSGDFFETVEGNTSSGSTIVPNGGGVYAKSYYNSNLPGTKFCRVDWEYAAFVLEDISEPEKEWLEFGDAGAGVKELQTMLNKVGFDSGTIDGEFGQNTENALKRFQAAYGLAADGQYGKNSEQMLEDAYNALDGASVMESDKKGLCIANKQLIGRVYPNGTHLMAYPKGTWLHPFLKQKDSTGRWWFACRVDGKIQWFSSTGFNGWVKDSIGWWYLLKGYDYWKGQWRRIRGLWYEFKEDGYIKTSCWSAYKGRKRYLKADGSMAHGETLVIDGKKYTFEEGGGVKE